MGRRSYYDTDEERLPEGMTRIGYDADTETYTFRDADGSIWESAPGSRYGNLTKISNGSAAARRAAQPTGAVARGPLNGKGGGDDSQRAYNDNDDDDDDDVNDSDRAPFLAPPAYSASAAAATLSTRGGSDDALPLPSAAEARYRDWRKRSWRADLMPLLHFFLVSSLFLVGIFWMVGGFSGGSSSTSSTSEKPEPHMPPPVTAKPAAPTGCPDGWATSVVYRGQTCYMIAKMHGVELDELLRANKGVNCDLLQIGEMICVPKTE